jgi:hypothetical protein
MMGQGMYSFQLFASYFTVFYCVRNGLLRIVRDAAPPHKYASNTQKDWQLNGRYFIPMQKKIQRLKITLCRQLPNVRNA